MLRGNMFVPTDSGSNRSRAAQGAGAWPARSAPCSASRREMQADCGNPRVAEGPADQSGILQGDVVVSVDGQAVKTHVELYEKLWKLGAAGVEVR